MASAPAPLDFHNVQGDILVGGLPKRNQTFFFFQIDKDHVQDFRKQLAQCVPLIISSAQVLDDRKNIDQHKKDGKTDLIKLSGVNISFTQKGLATIGINDKIGDDPFEAGMLAGASALGDKGMTSASGFDPAWVPAFKQEIHGVILVTGDCHSTTHEKLDEIKKIFKVDTPAASIHKVIDIDGVVRPGKEKGHEHFGHLDGISQPAVKDVDTETFKGQETVRQGIMLLGRDGDTPTRPSWALDGSFLAFRYLFQLRPEFDDFKKQKAEKDGIDVELLGARLMGRWKSGAPTDVAFTADDAAIAADPNRINDFSYTFPNDQQTQERCPFAAHLRKTNPRGDLETHQISTEPQRIIRSGIPFGPEVSAEEATNSKTTQDRGLLFVAYQSNIKNGFQFVQQSWANNAGFPVFKSSNPGFDPIIGQAPDEGVRTMSGSNPKDQAGQLRLDSQFVVSKGGDYFFSPSIPTLKERFALAA